MERYDNFKDFYPYYLSEHDNKHTKLLHFIGTSIAIFFYVRFFMTFEPMFLLYSLLSGYGFAWVAHFLLSTISQPLSHILFIVLLEITLCTLRS